MSNKINSATKLSTLLAQYPFLRDRLELINAKFRLLQTPLAWIMLRRATIAEMSRQSGTSESDIILGIERLIAEGA